MYMVVVGAGRTGSSLVEMATRDGNDVAVIEKDEDVAEGISRSYDCLVLNADATNGEVLEEAGIERADAVISTTDEDTLNIMILLLAREYDVPSLVSVVHQPEHIPIFEKIGANIIENPQRLIADYLYHSVKYPGVEDFMAFGEATEFIELEAKEDAPVVGVSLREARDEKVLPDGSLVAAIKRGDEVVTPKGETTVEEGDTVTVLVNEASLGDVLEAFGHEKNGG